MLRLTLTTLAALLVLAPASALAAPAKDGKRTIYDSPLLWSTINLCDTKAAPDTMGVRASMPGSGRRGETMYMRFQVQYRSSRDGLWHNFTRSKGTDSGRIKVGSARFKSRRSGWRFPFAPDRGDRFVLRGVVTFEWRKGGKIVRREKKKTARRPRSAGAKARRASAARCVVRG